MRNFLTLIMETILIMFVEFTIRDQNILAVILYLMMSISYVKLIGIHLLVAE
jgi:hypothetical protein